MTVGERIKQVRESLGISQDELAKRMGYKDRSSISKIEKTTDFNISVDTVQKFAEVLNCSPLFLMGWDKNEKNSISREEVFVRLYKELTENEKELIDNMLSTLSSKK